MLSTVPHCTFCLLRTALHSLLHSAAAVGQSPRRSPRLLDKVKAPSISYVLLSVQLTKLEKLDLSHNQLASIPVEIAKLKELTELNLDDNVIVSIPQAAGSLKKLKVLSLRNNRISHPSNNNAPPFPASLFAETPLIDLNLHGNPMTSTQLNTMEGYDAFLKRRQVVKTSALMGGAMTNVDVCGLEQRDASYLFFEWIMSVTFKSVVLRDILIALVSRKQSS
jgi:hypothetical protein